MYENIEMDIDDKRWKLIGKRYKEMYPVASDFTNKVVDKIQEIFEKISPYYGEKASGTYNINENGKVTCYEPFIFQLGSIGEIIDELMEKKHKEIIDEMKENIGDLINEMWGAKLLKKCPHCGVWNPVSEMICKDCKKELDQTQL